VKLSQRLQQILNEEILAGNSIESEYENAFQKTKLLVILRHPFHRDYRPVTPEITFFACKDTHYPVGDGYYDEVEKHSLEAPFGLFSNDI